MKPRKNLRFVSRLTRQTLALVLAGGRGSRLYELTDWRAKPAVPFGGKFRIIDFPLSNCINTGIRRIGVLTQYKAHSLIRHLVRGWSRFDSELDEFVEILPASQRAGGEWYLGTADAVYQNLDIMRTHQPEYVLILSGDHIYKMDYADMIATHVDSKADMTIACLEVPLEEAAGAFGVMTVNESGRIVEFNEKPTNPAPIPGEPGLCLASMGNYLFNTEFLYEQLIKDADDPKSDHDFGKNIIPSIIDKYQVYAFPFRDMQTGKRAYWRDVGTLDAFWEANMELVNVSPELNLYDQDWPILTHQSQLPPAKFVFDSDDGLRRLRDFRRPGHALIAVFQRSRAFLCRGHRQCDPARSRNRPQRAHQPGDHRPRLHHRRGRCDRPRPRSRPQARLSRYRKGRGTGDPRYAAPTDTRAQVSDREYA